MLNIHLWHLRSTKPTRWSSRTNMLAASGRQQSPLMNWSLLNKENEFQWAGNIKISRTLKKQSDFFEDLSVLTAVFEEPGIKMRIWSIMPCNVLTFTFLEKHVSLNYNPCWYQNVCSLNIYQPWVTSKAVHRHLETSFFLSVVSQRKCSESTTYYLCKWVNSLSTQRIPPTPQTARRREENICHWQTELLKIWLGEDSFGFQGAVFTQRGRECNLWTREVNVVSLTHKSTETVLLKSFNICSVRGQSPPFQKHKEARKA